MRIRPVIYQLAGGPPVKIDCVTDVRQATSLKSERPGNALYLQVTVDEVQSGEGITAVNEALRGD